MLRRTLPARASSPPARASGFALFALTLFAVLALPRIALAWVDVTLASDDIRVEVATDGTALIDHAVVLKIKGGPMRSFDLANIDLDAVFQGEGTVESLGKDGLPKGDRPEKGDRPGKGDKGGKSGKSDKSGKGDKGDSGAQDDASDRPSARGALVGAPQPARPQGSVRLSMQPDGSVRISSDEGLSRGNFLIRFKYKTDLVKRGALRRDGSMARLEWAGPKWPNGVDTARCTVSVISAPTEPRPLSDPNNADDTEASADSRASAGVFLSTLKRRGDRDELELIRPHVSRGDSVLWSARIDPKTIGMVDDPKVKQLPSTSARAAVQGSMQERRVFASVALGVAILFVALVGIKIQQASEAAQRAGVVLRPFLAMPPALRPLAAGLLVAAGVALQLFLDPPLIGSALLVLAMAVMAHRTPLPRPVSRGPGRWLALGEEEAFVRAKRAPNTWLDASTRSGKIGLLVALLAIGGATFGVYRLSSYHAALVALDGLVLLALFCTGREAELPPSLVASHAATLRKIRDILRKEEPTFRIVPWARFAEGEATPDELRLLVMPKTPLRGLNAVEIAFSYASGPGGHAPCPEILLRVAEDSVAEDRARELAPIARWVTGRKPGERVAQLEPTLPTARMTATLARRLCRNLNEKPAATGSASSRSGARENTRRLEPETVAPLHPSPAE